MSEQEPGACEQIMYALMTTDERMAAYRAHDAEDVERDQRLDALSTANAELGESYRAQNVMLREREALLALRGIARTSTRRIGTMTAETIKVELTIDEHAALVLAIDVFKQYPPTIERALSSALAKLAR